MLLQPPRRRVLCARNENEEMSESIQVEAPFNGCQVCFGTPSDENAYAHRKNKIVAVGKPVHDVLYFRCKDTGSEIFDVPKNDINIHCPGDKDQPDPEDRQLATDWNTWDTDVEGTLNLRWDYCVAREIPFENDPKHPRGLFPNSVGAVVVPDLAILVDAVTIGWHFTDRPRELYQADASNPNVLKRHMPVSQGVFADGLPFTDAYLSAFVSHKRPGFTADFLRGSPVRIIWIAVRGFIEREQRIPKFVALTLTDPRTVQGQLGLDEVAAGTVGKVKLSQAAFNAWNLDT